MTYHIIPLYPDVLFYLNPIIISFENVFVCVFVCMPVWEMLSLSLTASVLRRGWHTQRRGSTRVLAHSTQADRELPHTWPGPHTYEGEQDEEKQE